MSRLYHFKGFDLVADSIEVHVHMRETAERVNRAHRNLKMNVWNSMRPFVPVGNGTGGHLLSRTQAANDVMLDTEYLYAAVGPYGRFHYHGMVMVGEETGSPFAREHERKVVTKRPLTWSNKKTVPRWFDAAKKRDLKKWIKMAQEDVEGG